MSCQATYLVYLPVPMRGRWEGAAVVITTAIDAISSHLLPHQSADLHTPHVPRPSDARWTPHLFPSFSHGIMAGCDAMRWKRTRYHGWSVHTHRHTDTQTVQATSCVSRLTFLAHGEPRGNTVD